MSDVSKRVRLALIAHRFQYNDGQGRVNYEVARAALAQGYAVTLIAAHCEQDIANHPFATFVNTGCEWLPTQLLRNLAFAQDSARWLRAHRSEFHLVQANGFITWEPCDIVTAHFVHADWARSVHFEFADFSLNPYKLYQKTFTKLSSIWEKRAFRTARFVIAVSESIAREVHRLGVPMDRIGVIFNGVDTEEFHPGTSERESFGLPKDVPLALFVGDIRTKRKNLETLLRAMIRIPDLHVVVAGDPRDSPYPGFVDDLGIADHVHFIGKSKHIPILMRSVDMFVMPSRYEPFGLVVLEAMASGLPVIASANVGAVEVAGDACIIIDDPEDAEQLSVAILSLIESPDKAQALGRAARLRALQFQWSRTANGYLDCYQALLRDSKRKMHHWNE